MVGPLFSRASSFWRSIRCCSWADHGTDALRSNRIKTLVVDGQFIEPGSIFQELKTGMDTEGSLDLLAEEAWSGSMLFWVEAIQAEPHLADHRLLPARPRRAGPPRPV